MIHTQIGGFTPVPTGGYGMTGISDTQLIIVGILITVFLIARTLDQKLNKHQGIYRDLTNHKDHE